MNYEPQVPLLEDAAKVVLEGGPRWRSTVEGYAGRESYAPGETVTVHCSSAITSFSVTITRVGAQREVVWSACSVRGEFRDVPDDAHSTGCGWPTTFEFRVDEAWASGFYEVRFSWPKVAATPEQGTYACFVVRSPRPSAETPLLVLSTTTWQAYNEWGGSGLYRGAPMVSVDRPYERGFLFKRSDLPEVRATDIGTEPDPRQHGLTNFLQATGYGIRSVNAGWFQWERRFVQWAESKGYKLDFAVSADLEFIPEILDHRRLLLSVGHDEYWSAGMRDTVESFTASGGNAAFFSGDICTGKIRFHEAGRRWTSYVMHGGPEVDPEWPDGDFTGWWSNPLLGRPETEMTGVSTQFAGYARFGRAAPRGGRGFLVQQPNHWVFNGTDLMWGDMIGASDCLAGFELSGCEVELRANRFAPTGRFGTPEDTQILAATPAHLWRANESSALFEEEGDFADSVMLVARNLHGEHPSEDEIERLSNGWASMVLHEPGGTVFAAATTEWAFGLGDEIIARITENVLSRLLTRPSAVADTLPSLE